MHRWLERIWILAVVSLAIHLGFITVMKLLVPAPRYVIADATTKPSIAPLIVPMPEFPKPIEREDPNVFGEKVGEGESVASLDLPNKMQSEKPDDFEQAWLSQKPSLPTPPQTEQSSKKSSTLVPSGLQTELPAMSKEKIGKGASAVEAKPEDRPTDEQASDGEATNGTDGEDQKAAEKANATPSEPDPAPQGETDADPFAEAEGISLVGGVKARKGREIKFSRPRVDLAFRAEFTRLVNRKMRVGFRIKTDEEGWPRNVEIVQSSGSADIDESLRMALFDSWFGGKMPDEFPFVIRFHGDE